MPPLALISLNTALAPASAPTKREDWFPVREVIKPILMGALLVAVFVVFVVFVVPLEPTALVAEDPAPDGDELIDELEQAATGIAKTPTATATRIRRRLIKNPPY
jgi:hypothetical protein